MTGPNHNAVRKPPTSPALAIALPDERASQMAFGPRSLRTTSGRDGRGRLRFRNCLDAAAASGSTRIERPDLIAIALSTAR